MLFRVLGPLEVDTGDGPVVAARRRAGARRVAVLLLPPGMLVPVHRLAELVWGEDPVERLDNTVHVTVGRLRRALGPAGAPS